VGYATKRALPSRLTQRRRSRRKRKAKRAPRAKRKAAPRPPPRPKRAKRAKPPCKYGPRDPVTGLCPKKPKPEAPKAVGKLRQVVFQAAEKAVIAGGGAARTAAVKAYRADPEGTMAAARELGKAAFKVAGAAALGYAIGNAVNSFTAYMAPDERKLRLANAYRAARADAAARLGRPLSPEEVRAMGETYKAAVAKIDQRTPVGKVLEFIRSHIHTPS